VGDWAINNTPELKRRSTRVVQAVPLTVSGVDALGRPFTERTSTLIVNCHGCRYQSKHYVLKNMWVTLEVPNPEQGQEPRMARARVMWIQRPRTVRELFQVGVEMEIPGNLWGIAFPPPDWFPLPEGAGVFGQEVGQGGGQGAGPASGEWTTTGPALDVVEEDNLRTMPLSVAGDQAWPQSTGTEPSSARVAIAEQVLARQMAQLVLEAKQQLQDAIRESTAQTVSEEAQPLLAALLKQVQETAERSVETATPEAVRGAVEQAAQSGEAQLRSLQERWNQELGQSMENASIAAWRRFDELAAQRNTTFEQQLQDKLQFAMENAELMAGRFNATVASAQETLQQLSRRASESADAILQQVEQRIQYSSEQARRQLADLDEATRQLDERVSSTSTNAQMDWQARLDADVAATRERWNQQMAESLESAAQQAAERLRNNFEMTATQFDQDMQARHAVLGSSLAETRSTAESSLEALRGFLANETAKAQETLGQLRSASEAMEGWSNRAGEITRSAQQELERRAAAVVEAESRQLASRAEEGIAAWTGRLEPALEMAGRQAIERLGGELERQLDSGLDRASHALEQLQRGTSEAQNALREQQVTAANVLREQQESAANALRAHEEAVARLTTQQVENAVNRVMESVERLEKDLGESGRAATAKWLAELDAKSTEQMHATFESMFKTAEWYEKKVHNQMQASMDKGLEQAGTRLREKAGEISGLFATELDHYSRRYVEHAQGQLEEVGREALEGMRQQSAELTAATGDSLRQQAREHLDAALAEMIGQSSATVEGVSEQMETRAEQVRKASDAELFKSAAEFQANIAREKEQAVDSVKQDLAAQAASAQEVLRLATENAEAHLRQTLATLSDESMEEYKTRLENASNSWLVATVSKLDQQSEEHIEGVARSTEARLVETCNEVFAGLGENLRSRMLDLFGSAAGQGNSPESK
jgi:hypothetical protein